MQKQFTSTTLVQLAAELPSAKHCDTFYTMRTTWSSLVKAQDSPHAEYPLKLGNCALLVGVAVVELLALALVLELASLGAVAVEDTDGNVDGGTGVSDPHAVDVNWQTMSKRVGSIVRQRFSGRGKKHLTTTVANITLKTNRPRCRNVCCGHEFFE